MELIVAVCAIEIADHDDMGEAVEVAKPVEELLFELEPAGIRFGFSLRGLVWSPVGIGGMSDADRGKCEVIHGAS